MHDLPTIEGLGRAICSLNTLVDLNLTTFPLPEDTITHLSLLPTLQHLAILITNITFRISPLASGTATAAFPSLRSLRIHTQSDNTAVCTTFLTNISAPDLSSLSLAFELHNPTSAIHSLFNAISNFQQLWNLELNFAYSLPPTSYAATVHGDAIIPLFKLKSIYTFDMRSLPIELTTEHWRGMAEAWPMLSILSVTPLISDGDSDVPSYRTRIPFHDLAILAQLLSNLRILTVETEEPQDDRISDVVTLLPLLSMVTDVNLLQSAIPCETIGSSRVFLRQIFPNADFAHANLEI